MSGMEPERREDGPLVEGPLAGEGSQGGAQQREQEVLHQQEHWGAALTRVTRGVGLQPENLANRLL
eukprot:384611-Pelagomonas_calceolata.AAC.1